MSKIKSSDTEIELKIRKYIWKNGPRGYRIKSNILGKPDLYYSKQKLAIFIDGCFWHRCPIDFIRPKSRNDYWDKKIKGSTERDRKINLELNKRSIKVLRFWEHEIANNLEKCYSILRTAYEENTRNN